MSKSDPLTNKEIVVVAVILTAALIGSVAGHAWSRDLEGDELLRVALAIVIALPFLIVGAAFGIWMDSKRAIRKHVREHHLPDEPSTS
jgi:ABC-type spermidine/putrescine transport system permease subunit II